ncbi:hypothetical protein [Streptomyces noursei]|uniref:Uncharacterized protein n=1 Tax=Streptomyces noursei TaxID=1971 RepID=A0A2N8PQZ1_STRNR|nr:hypothetical protein [Streptomyces noursei]PNE43409.1 hypothetical protein AOB60_00220 [Streptomyces noursei]
MKLTELIARAQAAVEAHGDLDVGIPDGDCGFCPFANADTEIGDCNSASIDMVSGYAPELRFLLSRKG